MKELKADAEVLKPQNLEAFNKALNALINKKKPEILGEVITVVSREMQAVRDPWGSLTAFEASHATGMQIDIPTGTYRFWDVNFGMFSYDKLETMVQAYSEFLHDFYDGKYNDFVVTQYVPVTASSQS